MFSGDYKEMFHCDPHCLIRWSMFLTINILSFILPCNSEFHPIYNALMGDPMVRLQLVKQPAPDNSRLFLKSILAYPNFPGPFPAVIILHDKFGRDAWADSRALYFSRQGMVGYALDYLGLYADTEEGGNSLEASVRQDRHLFLARLKLALDKLKEMVFVNHKKVVVIGYGLGGLGALDMARAGWNISSVIAVDPILDLPQPTQPQASNITQRLLMFHSGSNDDQLRYFTEDLSEHNADWQLHMYGPTYKKTGLKPGTRDPVSWTYTLMFVADSVKD